MDEKPHNSRNEGFSKGEGDNYKKRSYYPWASYPYLVVLQPVGVAVHGDDVARSVERVGVVRVTQAAEHAVIPAVVAPQAQSE